MKEEQILKNKHISTSEIKQDITDTQEEVDDFNAEKDILMKRPMNNKVRIYMLEGHITKATEFINSLKEILNYRNNNKTGE